MFAIFYKNFGRIFKIYEFKQDGVADFNIRHIPVIMKVIMKMVRMTWRFRSNPTYCEYCKMARGATGKRSYFFKTY
jgi:hypothetical protein